jgi:hypothetical protein
LGGSRPDHPPVVVSDVVGECQFDAGQHTNRYRKVLFGRKAARGCPAKRGADQSSSRLGGSQREVIVSGTRHKEARLVYSSRTQRPFPLCAERYGSG